MGNTKRWTKAHEIERLSQLIFDIESATGRFISLCLVAQEQMPSVAEQWQEAAEAAEAAKNDMVGKCKVLLDRCCKEL